MGSSRDPSPITPDTIRSTAEQLPDEGVSADSIRSTAEQLPEAPSIDPDSIRSVAERLPGESAPEDTGFMDQLAGIALAANPKNFSRTLARQAVDTYEDEGVSGLVSEAGGAVQDVLSQAGKQFFRGRSQEALDRARFMLSEETSAATEPRRRIDPSTPAAPLQDEAAQAAARDAVQRAEELQDRAESFEGAPAVQEVTRQMQQGDFAGAFQTMQQQPSFLPALGIGTMAQQPAALAATSGLMAGAGAAAPAGLATTLATGTAGAGGSFLTADIVEGRAELARSLREAGADVSDTDDVLTKLQDPEFRREVEERVDTRVASIGTVDALANLATMGMASSGMARPVTALLGAGGEIAAEGAGEATAQYATRGEISPADVALESLAGVFGPATVEAGTQVAASGDGQAAQARQTSDLVEEIRQRAEEAGQGQGARLEQPPPSTVADRVLAAVGGPAMREEQPTRGAAPLPDDDVVTPTNQTNPERAEVIEQARQQQPQPGPAEEVPASPQRPLADMDDDALENAREEALSAKDLETVQLIDEELSLREQESATDGADGDDTAQSDRAGERRSGGQGQNNRPTQRRGAPREQPPARPDATPEAEASLRALDAVEQARQEMQRREQARQELGLGQVPEDPAPDVDARVDDTDTDEQGQAPEQPGREGGDREGAQDPEDEPGAAQADEVPADERGERGAADEGRRGGEAGAQGEVGPGRDARQRIDEALEEMEELRRSARTRRRHARLKDEEGAQDLRDEADRVGAEVVEDLEIDEWVEGLERGDRIGDQVVTKVDPDGERAGGVVGLMSEEQVEQFRDDEAVDEDPIESDVLPGTATSGLEAYRRSLEEEQRAQAGAQGELDEDMGLRPDTRPEEQVDEAVEEAREQVRSAEEELRSVEEQIQGALRDSDPETIQRLAEQTSSDRVRQQLEAELARRQEQGDMFGGGAQGQGGQAGDLFGQGAAESTSGLERLVRRLEQREAGVEQARQELLRREQQQADRRQQAREAQQELDVESDEEADEESPASSTEDDREGTETGGAGPNQEASEDAAQAPQEPEYTPPTPEEPGRLTVPQPTTDGGVEAVEATVTEDAVQAPGGATPEALRRLADEAARRDKALETSETVSQENAQALYRLAQDGYEVTRAPSAMQSDAGVTAEGEPAFRVRAPRFDQTRPTTETSGVTVGRAAQSVTRETAQSARSDAFADTDTSELRTQLEEAVDSENEQAARRLQSELDRRQNPPTQTTYRHREGDLVVVDEDGRFLDARSGERYYEAVAEYFAANEQELRAGVVEPRTDEGAYARTVARSSGSPQQVLEVYNTERARGEEGQDPVEDMMDATRYSTASFDEYADPNWRQDNGQLTMEWLGGDKSLDARAQEITEATGQETTPQDVVDHITENPQGPSRRSEAQRLRDDLEQRFEELTGITLTPDLADRIQSEQVEDLPDATDEVEGDPGDPFTPTGDAPFQRMAEQDGRRPAADLVEVYLRKIAANLGAPITVVDTPAGLEGRAAEAYERGRQRAGQDFSQPAMFLDGEVYVIASDVEANARAMGQGLETFARQTVMHEAVAHKGLRELLGDEFAATMDALFESIGRGRLLSAQTQDGTPLADAYAPELETSEDGTLTAESRQLLVEEYLARLAEDMAAPESVVQQIFRRVRDAIQRVFGVRITETDLRLLLEASRDHLRSTQQRNPVSSTRFSRQASGSVPAARWMMVGSRATDFEQAQDEGRTFQGLDEEIRFEISDADAQFAEDGPLWNFVTGARKAKDFTQRLESADDPSDEVVRQAEDAQKKRTVAQASLEEGVALEDAIAHDRLFEQYPDLRDVVLETRPMDGGAQASYNPSIETITLNLRRLEEAADGNFEQAAAVIEDVLQSVLHEVQHAVQHLEGFSGGDSPNRRIYQAKRELSTRESTFKQYLRARDALSVARMVENTGRDLEAAIEEQIALAESDPARTIPVEADNVQLAVEVESIEDIKRKIERLRGEIEEVGLNPDLPEHQQILQREGDAAQMWQQRRAHNLYRRTSGEVEARLTAERRDVPQEERITETEELRRAVEYDPEEVIVRYSRQREDPNQLGLFHDPESGDSGVPGGKRNMVTLHNLDPQNIRFAVQQMDGYLPVPSLATVRYEDGFAQFGDITLLGDPELVDPESGTPTFGGDAYTPTTPGPAYEGDVDAWLDSGVQEQIEKWSGVLGRSDASGIYSYVQTGNRSSFYSMMTRAPAALMAFREAQGEQILARDLPRKEYDGFMGAYLLQDSLTSFLDGLSDAELNRMPYAVMENNEAHDPQLASDVTSALEAAVQEHAEENFSGPPERRQEKAEVLLGAHLSEDGRPSFNTLDRLRRSYLDYKNQDEQPVDTGQVREDAKARVQEHVGADSWREAREEMEAYWRDKVDPFSGPRMKSDTSEPYNLYNIVERMRERGVRAAEGSGINFLRAIAVEQFGTLEEVQAMRDRLTSREEYKQAAARLEDDFKQLWKNLKRSHEVFGLPDTTPRRKALEQAIADYVPRRSTFEEARNALNRSGFESVPAGDVQAFMGFVEDLRSEPVQYFESKPQRAVALEEFEAAIVPDDLPSDVREQLGETVGRVAEYEAGSDADRQQTLAEESARADVRFRRQGRPSGNDLSANPNARWKRVFHGSPYDFEAFDTSEIGSGEGNQAFGWGLYFTEKEAIAEHYAESVTQQKRGRGGPTIRARIGEFGDVGGWAEITQFAATTPNQEQRDLASAIREGMRRIRLNEANPSFESEKVLDRAIEGVENDLNPGRFRSPPEGDRRERMENTLETLRSMAPEDLEISGADVQPTVYTVEMHGGREPSEYNYVQWRKEGDGAKIANALWDYRDQIGEPVREEGADFPTLEQELVDEIVQGFDGEAFVPSIPELSDDTDATGGEVYRMLGRYMKANAEAAMQEFNTTDHQEAVSKLLLRAGIDGIKYEADQGRADAFNYTVFDDNAVRVAEKVRFQRQQTGEGEADATSDVPPNPNAFTQDWSIQNLKQLAKREWRRWFEQRSLLPESVWQAKMERDGALAAGMERVRYALRDFGHALEQAYNTQDPDAETARRLNEALQNGYRADVDPEQAELFAPEEEPVAAQEAPAGVVTTSEGNQIELFGAAPPTSPAVTAPERQTLADMTFIEDLPDEGNPSVREAVSTLRDHIDALTALGLKAGLWKGELRTVVTENLGTYVTRSYKVHHEEDYGNTVKQAVREYANEDLELDPDNVPESLGVEADTWNRAVTAMRNLHPGMSNERVLGELFGLLTTDEEGGLYEGGSKLGSVGQSIYERRKDIPSPLRDLMGEYKEPGQNYLRSMNKMLQSVTSQKFLNQVKQAGLGEWLRREPTVEDGTEYTEEIAAEGSRTMAPLNGLYTTKEIKQAFETFDQPATLNKAYRWYMRAAGTVKEMLTKYSVKLQVRNLTSAFGFGMSQGHMFDENYLDAYRTAFPTSFNRVFQQEDSEAQRELTQKLLRLQVLDEAPRIGDIEETWRDAGAMMEDPLGDGIDTVWEKYYRQADEYATRAYQAGDNVHKIAGFLIEKARYADAYPNRSEQEIEEIAARRVRNTFPTYSLVPKGIRRLRRNPLASSFPSFFAEIVRNRANTLRLIKEEMQDPRTRPIAIKRAAGEMVNASIWAGVAYGGMALAGVDDEFDDYFRRHLPSWEKYSYLFYYPSEEGEQSFVDIGYLNPNATFHEPVLAALGGEEVDEKSAGATAAYRFLAPFVSPEILTQSVAEAAFNESYESGGPIYNPELPPTEKAEEAAKHIAKDFTPGVLEQANDIRQSFAADQEGYGEDAPTKLEALASTFLGQSMRTVEADNSWKWKTINLQSQYRDAGSIWYQALTERGSVSRSELEERYRTSLQRKQELVQKAHKDLIGAELMGLSEQEAYSIMDAQGAADALKADVMAGRFRPRPDFNILSGRIQSERQSGNEEDAERLQERAEVAREIMQEVSQEFRRPSDEDAAGAAEERLSNTSTQQP